MKHFILVGILLFGFAFAGNAQEGDGDPEPGDCGNGLPCGPIPWALPYFPPLISPTPISENVDVNPNPFTNTPEPTNENFFDTDAVDQMVSTVGSVLDSTAVPIYNAEGTAIGQGDLPDLATNSELFFSYAKGLSFSNVLGVFTPLVGVVLFYFSINFFIAALKYMLPLIVIIVGIVRKIVNVILNFT